MPPWELRSLKYAMAPSDQSTNGAGPVSDTIAPTFIGVPAAPAGPADENATAATTPQMPNSKMARTPSFLTLTLPLVLVRSAHSRAYTGGDATRSRQRLSSERRAHLQSFAATPRRRAGSASPPAPGR